MIQVVVESLFKGIASSKATGLSVLAWDTGSMLAKGRASSDSLIPLPAGGSWIARSAELRARSSEFDRSVARFTNLFLFTKAISKTYGRGAAQALAAHCALAFPCLRAISKPPSAT